MNQETSPLHQLPFPRERFFRRERRSVPAARAFTRRRPATNALLHGVPPGRGFVLRLLPYGGDGGLRVEVHDSGDGVPDAGTGVAGEGGRGLLLVGELADKWGVGERHPGKVVWCEFGT